MFDLFVENQNGQNQQSSLFKNPINMGNNSLTPNRNKSHIDMPLYAKKILPKAHVNLGNQPNLDDGMKLYSAGHVKIHAKVMENRLKEIIK